MQGRAQKFERGRRPNLKASVFRPKSNEEQKKVNTSADVQIFRPKSRAKKKKKDHHALRLSFIRILPLHHESYVHLSAEGGAPGYAPAMMNQRAFS